MAESKNNQTPVIMNLSETDKELIADIVKYLKELNTFAPAIFPPFKPQPAVDVVEPEKAEEVYVKANKTIGQYITKDKWYLVVEEMFEHYRITQDNGNVASTHKLHFDKPVSKAEYLAQQKEVELNGHCGENSSIYKHELLNSNPIKEVEKELSEPKPEESTKWNVIVEQFEHNKKDHKIVLHYTDHHILTEELAQSAATKIREILLGV